jgi:hypothetical protein
MLALYLWIVLIYFSPDYFQKYTADIIDTEYRSSTFDKTYYYDLNGDGISERIVAGYNYPDEQREIRIQHFNLENKIYNQWMPRGKWLRLFKPFFGDYNNNGFAEVYCLTIENDSVFLSIKELMKDDGLEVNGRFICKAGTFKNGKNDVADLGGKLMDVNNDNILEYVFFIYGGFSKFPRNSFVYFISSDSLKMSPKSASGINSYREYMDINGDGITEITGYVGSPENIHYKMPFTDSASWLMVINPVTMNFHFPPIKFDLGIASNVRPVFFKINHEPYIAVSVFSNSAKTNINHIQLLLFDKMGNLLKENRVKKEGFKDIRFIVTKTDKEEELFLIDNFGNVYKADTLLNYIKYFTPTLNVNGLSMDRKKLMDIDGDGENELVVAGGNKDAEVFLLIYRENLKDVLSLKLPKTQHLNNLHFGLIHNGTLNQTILMVQTDKIVYKIKYRKNPYYLMKYPAYAGIYILLFLVFWLLQRVQTNLARQKFETEKQLINQQMAISKRQLEPHFMLNTLNNIGYMFAHENKEDAQYYFGKFSSLIHRGLKYADQVETSLGEELKFVRDYLILQKIRMNDDLDFTIEADENIELNNIKIPHSLIFTFVENAIKHGLRPKPKDRELKIIVKQDSDKIIITITDNGIGRKQSHALKTTGTGKRMSIVANIVEGYNKLNKRDISFEVKDLFDEEGNSAGTGVRIVV